MNASALGAVYEEALEVARATARSLGYALAVHGSELRDLDLVAVPWVEDCAAPAELAEAIRAAVRGVFSTTMDGEVVAERPHGRQSWGIVLLNVPAKLLSAKAGFRPYLDLSVMPPRGVGS